MRRALPPLLALLALLALLTSCKPPSEAADPNRPVVVTLLTTPARVGPAAIEVQLQVDGAPVSGALVDIRGDMTHAGMMSVRAATVTETTTGIHRSEGFAFNMTGDWLITAEVRYPDGVQRSGHLAITVNR